MYEQFLTTLSVFSTWQTLALLVWFFAIKIFSFALAGHIITQGALVFALLMVLGILYFKNPDWALCLVLGEIFLGGAGHYLEFIGLSIRTLFIGFFLFLWLSQQVGQRLLKQSVNLNKPFNKLFMILFVFLIFSAVNGIYQGHPVRDVVQDLAPFAFLLLVYPAYNLFKSAKTQEYLIRLIIVFILGTAIFSLFMFAVYSSGIGEIQDPLYKWFRDVEMGKITNMGNGFFRIVEPSQLVLAPFILLIASLLMRDEKHNKLWRLLMIMALIPFALNLSRGYMLALLIGFLVLKYKHNWKRWLIVSLTTLLLFMLIFTAVNLIASKGLTMGWELLGVRVVSFAEPQIEISSATRMLILPTILEIIKQHPLGGIGLGAAISYIDPVLYQTIVTRHFDWGYLEMWTELGIFGALALLAFVIFIISKLIEKIKTLPDYFDFDVGLLAGMIAFLVMNITAPALYHVFGIFYFVFVATISLKQTDIFTQTTTWLYRVFNRLKSN